MSTVPVGGVAVFESDDSESDDEKGKEVLPSSNLNEEGTEESCQTGLGQSLEPEVHNGSSDNNTDQGSVVPNENPSTDLERDIHLSDSVARESNPATSSTPSYFLFMWYFMWLYMFLYAVKVDTPFFRGHTPNESFQSERSAYESECPYFPCTKMDNESIRRGVNVQLANDTSQHQRCELNSCSNETEQSVSNSNLHPVNGTANESYMASMLRQEARQWDHQNVVNIQHQADETCMINMEVEPTIHEVRSTGVDDLLPNSRTRPPETQPQGVPHGGWIFLNEWCYLHNTCSLDQFLNGLHQLCRYRLIQQVLKELAKRSEEAYWHIWKAVSLCNERLFPEAKFRLVPVFDMMSSEGRRIMPLVERQLRHSFITRCIRCLTRHESLPYDNITFVEFDRCGGQTTSSVIFEAGTPPLILAVNLFRLRHLIPNSQSVNDREIVELFGERYMMFLFTFARRESRGITGHYMSRVFRPEGGIDRELDRPAGSWYFFPNNLAGDLHPWTTDQRDPDGTYPSYVYFIRLPAATEVAPCMGQIEQESLPSEDDDTG